MRTDRLDILFLCEWTVDYDIFPKEDPMPCGYIIRRGRSPMNRMEVRMELVLKAVPWWMLDPTTKFVVVALVGLIACLGGRPEWVSWDWRMSQSCHAECNVEEDR